MGLKYAVIFLLLATCVPFVASQNVTYSFTFSISVNTANTTVNYTEIAIRDATDIMELYTNGTGLPTTSFDLDQTSSILNVTFQFTGLEGVQNGTASNDTLAAVMAITRFAIYIIEDTTSQLQQTAARIMGIYVNGISFEINYCQFHSCSAVEVCHNEIQGPVCRRGNDTHQDQNPDPGHDDHDHDHDHDEQSYLRPHWVDVRYAVVVAITDTAMDTTNLETNAASDVTTIMNERMPTYAQPRVTTNLTAAALNISIEFHVYEDDECDAAANEEKAEEAVARFILFITTNDTSNVKTAFTTPEVVLYENDERTVPHLCEIQDSCTTAGEKCVNDYDGRKCLAFCEFGQYFDTSSSACTACAGTDTTLTAGAYMTSACVTKCPENEYYSLAAGACEACPTNTSRAADSTVSSCEVNTDVTPENRRIDIEINATVVYKISSCPVDSITDAIFSDTASEFARANIMLKARTMYFLNLCQSDSECDNFAVKLVRNSAAGASSCSQGPTCTEGNPCAQYKFDVTATLYNTFEYVLPVANMNETRRLRRSVDVVAELMYDISPLYYVHPIFRQAEPYIERPFKINSRVVENINSRYVNVTMVLDLPRANVSNENRACYRSRVGDFAGHVINASMPGRDFYLDADEHPFDSFVDVDGTTKARFNGSVIFSNSNFDVNDLAKGFLREHVRNGGHTLTGPIYIFDDEQSIGVRSSVNWCRTVQDIGATQRFCGGSPCQNDSLWFQCSPEASTVSMYTTPTTGTTVTTTPFPTGPVGIYSENCRTGSGYSWTRGICQSCDRGEYNDRDGERNYCRYCPFNTNSNRACLSTDGQRQRTVATRDIFINANYMGQVCAFSTPYSASSASRALETTIRTNFRRVFPQTSGVCINTNCDNVVVAISRDSNVCRRSATCTSTSNATQWCNFVTSLQASFYGVNDYISMSNGDVRKTQEIILESFGDFNAANQSSTPGENPRFSMPPTRVTVQSIPAGQNRRMYIRVFVKYIQVNLTQGQGQGTGQGQGGDPTGGNTSGNSTDGNASGGNTPGGNTSGGNTTGGNGASGNATAGSETGGNESGVDATTEGPPATTEETVTSQPAQGGSGTGGTDPVTQGGSRRKRDVSDTDLFRITLTDTMRRATSSFVYLEVTGTGQSTVDGTSRDYFDVMIYFDRSVAALATIIQDITIRSHVMVNGQLGTGERRIQFVGSVNIFLTDLDRQRGVSDVKWCSYLENQARRMPLPYCEENTECVDVNNFYRCNPIDLTLQQQRPLFPYGLDAGDSWIGNDPPESDFGWWWYSNYMSRRIYFPMPVPMGTRKFNYATVLPNGAVTFGEPRRATYPYLYRSSYFYWWDRSVIAPFWHSVNWRNRNASVYYNLYDINNNGNTTAYRQRRDSVLTKAQFEIHEQFPTENFQATTVLVATWENVEPYDWRTWICWNRERYMNRGWWGTYYEQRYQRYCFNQEKETATFQCTYSTDGQKAFVIVYYKDGAMSWRYRSNSWRRIEIGFKGENFYKNFDVSYTPQTDDIDQMLFKAGRKGTWIEKVGEIVSTDAKCRDFNRQNQYMIGNSTHDDFVDRMDIYRCPCVRGRLGRQFSFYSGTYVDRGGVSTRRLCYALGTRVKRFDRRLQGVPYNKLCCFYYTPPATWDWRSWRNSWNNAPYIGPGDPNSGHFLKNDPWWRTRRLSQSEDFDPQEWCRRDADDTLEGSRLFAEVRPTETCSVNVTWWQGRGMGDPHIATLDGKKYSFNAKGEYILLRVVADNFQLQGRMDQAQASNGNLTNATVFVAFAAKQGDDARVQVELNDDKTGMVITANGIDITSDFGADSNYSREFNDSLEVSRTNRDDVGAVAEFVFPTGISLEVFVSNEKLDYAASVPTTMTTGGLMGVMNSDTSDDFTLPNGNTLTAAQTNTSRDIFTNFGPEWRVTTANTVFSYPTGVTALNYSFPDFEPMFMEEIDPATRTAAIQVCGSAEADACIFDYAATRNSAFATATNNADQEGDSIQASLTNNLPTLTQGSGQVNQNGMWEVTEGEQSTFTFTATDPDNDNVTYELQGSPSGVTIDANTGVVTYTPALDTAVSIGVQATDARGGVSTVVYVHVAVCSKCSDHGRCDKTTIESSSGAWFSVYACDCWPAYNGTDCTGDVDGCSDGPCSDGRNCTDIPAAEQGNGTRGYSCGDCQSGFETREDDCVDIDECANTTHPPCHEHATCENANGNFSCSCNSGFREDSADSSVCIDINECNERTHDCEQQCVNTDGNFTCACANGQELNSDNRTCSADPTCTRSCEYRCVKDAANVQSCICKNGYELQDDGTSCSDINECTGLKNPCTQTCTNTDGSFTCSCLPGFQLSSDSVSCTECPKNFYGMNCASQCRCNSQGTCDRKSGCICSDGWTGSTCTTDVDECESQGRCPTGQSCVNSVGSFSCDCPTGFTKVGDNCEDFNECADSRNNTCSILLEDCENNVGSYSCACKSGYARSSTTGNCEDIDECAQGIDDCSQICTNVDGGFNCGCHQGYRLDNDRKRCLLRDDPCEGSNLNCDHNCTINVETSQLFCLCVSGYELIGTTTCQEVNECAVTTLNKCSYQDGCSNTVGGFTCSCQPGTYLDNDGRTCIECGTGKWGENCANECGCVQGTCDRVSGCQCTSGYKGVKCDEDIDECETRTCGKAQRCNNYPGGSECVCVDGYEMSIGECQNIDECALPSLNNCTQVCNDFAGGFRCSCNNGYQLQADAVSCTDVDECTSNLHKCKDADACENTPGGYRCTCPAGLRLDTDGATCISASQCNDTSYCGVFTVCSRIDNTDTCFCERGYNSSEDPIRSCSEINYCAGSNPCTVNCTTQPGGFVCGCDPGQKLAEDGFNCEECVFGKYGDDCSQSCDCQNETTSDCSKTNGTCICISGWTGTRCDQDIDECADTTICNSKTNSQCANSDGSYLCECPEGYFTNNGACEECADFWYGEECRLQCNCIRGQSTCDKVSGTCNCTSGWTGDRCDEDIVECADPNNECASSGRAHWGCKNSLGSFRCECNDGYVDNTTTSTCDDFDECASDVRNDCGQHGTCSNTDGSYTCNCNEGYEVVKTGLSSACVDQNECLVSNGGCSDICNNTEGSFVCHCNAGSSLDSDNRTCFESVSSNFGITLSNFDGTDIDEPTSTRYAIVLSLILEALELLFRDIPGFVRVVINSLLKGSVIVDATVEARRATNPTAATQLVEVLTGIAQNGIVVNGTTETAVVQIGTTQINSTTDKCTIMLLIETNCDCYLDSAGQAICRGSETGDDDDDTGLIVGLAVGIPLGLALIAAIGVAFWYKTKYKGQKRVNSQMGHYHGEDGRSHSPDTLNNFKVDMPTGSLIPPKDKF